MINKNELISQVAADTQFTKKDIKVVLDSILDCIATDLRNGEDVSFTNFGKFTTVKMSSREIKNPSNSKTITLEERHAPKFRPSTALKEFVK